MNIWFLTLLVHPFYANARYTWDSNFYLKVEEAMKTVELLLETVRSPQLLAEDAAQHKWTDKFTVTESMTNIAIAAYWNALDQMLLLDDAKRSTLHKWVHDDQQSVILRFEAQDKFSFKKSHQPSGPWKDRG